MWEASSEFVSALTVALQTYSRESLMEDLIAFSAHAKRKTIAPEDVRLVSRKCPRLVAKMEKYVQKSFTEPRTSTTPSTSAGNKRGKRSKESSGLELDDDDSSSSLNALSESDDENNEEELFRD